MEFVRLGLGSQIESINTKVDPGGGNIGLLYERGTKNAYEKITFARFSFYWLMK